jgi:transcriptional regulator with XRE-family HTH domain
MRFTRGLSQEQLAAKCCILGFDLSRGTLAKIEAGIRCVTDAELRVLARSLRVKMDELFPPEPRRRSRP